MMRIKVRFERGPFVLDAELASNARVTGLFGASGAGKSTLIHLIAGLQRPDRGVLEVGGRTLFDSERGVDVPAHRRGVGVVFQEHRLFPHLTVRGNIHYGRPRPSRREDLDGALRIIDLLELGGLLDRRVADISGGECQRVALGRALVSKPACLLLDEPLTSLDERLKRQILPYLRRVRDQAGVPMVYVSHDLTELLQLTDHLAVMEQGRVVGMGRYADLVHDQQVVDVIHDRGMDNVLRATIVEHRPGEGVTVVAVGAYGSRTQLIVPGCSTPLGGEIHVAIRPWDIALSADILPAVSIRNQLRGTVRKCSLHESRAIVEVDLGATLMVEVSRQSAAAMNLSPDCSIVCLIKSNAVRILDANHEIVDWTHPRMLSPIA